MKKIIQEILRSEQVLNLRDRSNRRYLTGMIMEAIRTEGWYLNIGTHRSTTKPLKAGKTNAQKISEFDPDGIEYSEFAHLSTDRPDEVTRDGDGKPLVGRRVKSYGFFKNEYYDD